MKHKTYDFRTAYIDLLLNVLTGIIFLFILTTLLIHPEKNNEAGIKKMAQYVINLNWPDSLDCDVDIYVQDPLNRTVNFQSRDNGIMHIERDDLGWRNDAPTGSSIINGIGPAITALTGIPIPEKPKDTVNQETWVLRGLMKGKFTVNAHLFSCRIEGKQFDLGQTVSVPVEVEMIKLNPSYQTIKKEKITLNKVWEEQPIFNFDLDESGNAVNFTKDYIKLVKEKK